MLIRERYDESATVSPSRPSMKRVTPSSKVSAIWYVTAASYTW
jgi:hypothetical protein